MTSPATQNTLDALAAIRIACGRDLAIALHAKSEIALVLVFFVLVGSLFPLSVAPDPKLLQNLGAGVAWVSALLATLMALPRMFAHDFADGTLEQLILTPAPLPALIAGKVLAQWLATGLPLVLTSPVLALFYGLGLEETAVLAVSLLLGTPTLCWLGSITAALTLGARGGGALLALLVLPLMVPILIFGAGSVAAVASGLGAQAHLSLLAAGLIVSTVLAPFAAALAVRIAFE